MLVLARHTGQKIRIEAGPALIDLEIIDVRGGKVRLGFTAPPSIRIDRLEVAQAKGAVLAVRQNADFEEGAPKSLGENPRFSRPCLAASSPTGTVDKP